MTKNEYILKIIWTKSDLAIAVEKLYKTTTIPLTTFFFWPREDGWKLLEKELDSKPWINQDDKIQILNMYTNIINIWIKNDDEKLSRLDKKKYKIIGL